jgi:hypothetical protein
MQRRTGHAKPGGEINRYRRLMHANNKNAGEDPNAGR